MLVVAESLTGAASALDEVTGAASLADETAVVVVDEAAAALSDESAEEVAEEAAEALLLLVPSVVGVSPSRIQPVLSVNAFGQVTCT